MNTKNKIRYSNGDRVFLALDWLIMLLVFVVIAYPLLFVIVASFNPGMVASKTLSLWPDKVSLEGYKVVFEYKRVWTGYLNSLIYTLVGTLINIVVTICAAYPLSRKDLFGRNAVMALFVFTMYFSGGMIPVFLQVKKLGLLNTLWAMVLPGALSVYNMIVMRTYFVTQIADDLREASELDGCGNLRFLLAIVLPLSGPILAVIALFYGVDHWNAYFDAMLYMTSNSKMPLQMVLRDILILNNDSSMLSSNPEEMLLASERASLMKYSLILVASLPMMMLYPFAQRYFVKGIMIGAVKG